MIGYYVHHHGQGHLVRGGCVAAVSDEPVIALSSLPEPQQHAFADWVALPPDPYLPAAADPQAGGAFHWTPLDAPDYRDRMAHIAGWITAARPRLVVVDVSVEVATLVRLLGTRVVVVDGPGERTDRVHEQAKRLATQVIAPWPLLDSPAGSAVEHTGAFSRFDGRAVAPLPHDRHVLVLLGAGGDSVTPSDLVAAAASTPQWTWRSLGGSAGWVDDPWDELMSADVVVTHAGLGTLAEVSAARRPAVVLPQKRPFGEQLDTAERLERAGLAEVRRSWPHPDEWPRLLAAAAARGGDEWVRWNDGRGAARFVHVLRDMMGCAVA